MKHVVKLTRENELNYVNLYYLFVSYNWKIPKFFLLNSFFHKKYLGGNAGRFWTLFFGFQALQTQAYFFIFIVFLLEVYHFDRILRKLAGFFPTQSAKLSIVKVSGGIITSNSLRGMPGSEPWRMRKVRTGEDLWRQSDQSTLWGLTDFLGPANSFSVEPKWNKSQIRSTRIYITVDYLKSVFWIICVNVLNERGSVSVPYGLSFALCF